MVTGFLYGNVFPYVLAAESAVVVAHHAVQSYRDGMVSDLDLARVLRTQALLVSATSHRLDTLSLPPTRIGVALQVRTMNEDLSLACDQLAALYQETATSVLQAQAQTVPVETLSLVSFDVRVRSILAIMRRAATWLETINQVTGARAPLPAFEPERPPVEAQLGL
jgi:hypothetical protein